MTVLQSRRRIGVLVLSSIAAATAALVSGALAASTTPNPVVLAVRHNDCDGAVKLVNPQLESNDAETTFLAGRMLNEGICVKKDPRAATPYFARAADLGNHVAELDYAAKIGLGEGATQDYERAGMLCRQAGIDPQSHSQTYALGYACTVGDVAAQMLRESLPKGAFTSNSGALAISFIPSSSQMHIRSTPRVGVGEAQTGSNLRTPLIDAQKEIDSAWQKAIAAVPKPDPSHLDDQPVDLTLDVDMALEAGQPPAQRTGDRHFGVLLGGEVQRGLAGGN